MSKRAHATILMLALAALSVGCAGSARRPRVVFGNARNLVFNPESTSYAMADVSRSPWPTTTTQDDPNADVTYLETIRDYQGQFSNQDNDYYRYVRSVRRGRGHR